MNLDNPLKGFVLTFYDADPYEVLIIQNAYGDLITIKIGILYERQ